MPKYVTLIIDRDLALQRAANDINAGKSSTVIIDCEENARELLDLLEDSVKRRVIVKTTSVENLS